jgi:hypothetical protein
MHQTKLKRTSKYTFSFSKYFSEIRVVNEIMWKKYCRTGQAKYKNTMYKHCMLDT